MGLFPTKAMRGDFGAGLTSFGRAAVGVVHTRLALGHPPTRLHHPQRPLVGGLLLFNGLPFCCHLRACGKPSVHFIVTHLHTTG